MKKITSLILALAMCFALGVPAFATETGNLTTELVSVLPELQITLPDSAQIILNPYRMTTTQSGNGIDSGDRFQIMSPIFSVVSNTTSKVHVKATVTGSVAGNAQFATAAVAEGAAGHNVYVELWHAVHASNTASIPYPESASGAKNFAKISDSEQTLEWDLPAKAAGSNATSQRVDMQFSGTCSDSPTAEEGPWTENDSVSCAFVFEVNPVTDAPMITTTYQHAATEPNLTFNTTKPADFKSNTGVIKSAKIGSATLTLTTTSDTWNGTVVTITPTALSTNLNVSAISYKTATVELEYEDSKTANLKHTVTYTVKVLCFPAPTA
jgi:hypothetical protein